MAGTRTSTPAANEHDEREFTVVIRPHDVDLAQYFGTRAQLEAEGVVPKATEWPDGANCAQWETDRFRFALKRTRPEGMKGPMRLWVTGDWWELRWELKNPPDWRTRRVAKKAAELAKEIERVSEAALRAADAQWERYWRARDDGAFLAFKSKVLPMRKRPGRPPRARSDSAAS